MVPQTGGVKDNALADLPPSAKLVYKTLKYEGQLTQSALAEETLLPQRTVREALARLEAADLVVSRPAVMDARKRVYLLAADAEPVVL
ncbi:MarR family transcriptional regulator [Halosegnis sp.]|uniref:MarR family transcriptional regulator n=1 Tax=Halosegnis sp. TaxID=2864959 RepID=UPI0035D3D8F0